MTEPTLALILTHAAALHGTSPGAMRSVARHDSSQAASARMAFCWLARQLTGHSEAAIGLYVALPLDDTQAQIDAVEKQLAANPALGEALQEAALEISVEASVKAKLGRNLMSEDRAPAEIAAQVMSGRANALTTGSTHLSHLACAYMGQERALAEMGEKLAAMAAQLAAAEAALKLSQRIEAVVAASGKLDAERFGPEEFQAQKALLASVATLVAAFPITVSVPAKPGVVQ